jgi:DNA/RNA-binding domain of Phe-tRNA-synthetase-like protein
MVVFQYDGGVAERFPTVRGVCCTPPASATDRAPPELAGAFRAEQQATLARLEGAPLAEVPSIAAWRRVFSALGVKPTQYRSAAEALLRRLEKHGEIPTLGLLVDLGNLVSIRYALPVAVLDVRAVTGTTTVRFATGQERFTDLGTGEPAPPQAGEVVFVDEADVASARRWCWRQSLESAASPSTTEILVVVEGHHASADADVAAALDDLSTLLGAFQPEATVERSVLSPAQPRFLGE